MASAFDSWPACIGLGGTLSVWLVWDIEKCQEIFARAETQDGKQCVCVGGKGGARVGYPTGAHRARRVDDAGWGRGKGEEGNPNRNGLLLLPPMVPPLSGKKLARGFRLRSDTLKM